MTQPCKLRALPRFAGRGIFTTRFALCALTASALALDARAQSKSTASSDISPPTSSSPSDKPLELEDFVVSEYRRSLEVSLDTKRAADATVDVITAEDVGKFPDTNVAESLSHIPGVTVDRLYGEGERVSILGTDPRLNRTLLNGQTVASGDWYILDAPSRQFNYTLLAPEVIGQAEVYKTQEAMLPEGSIGGTVLLHTRSPLDSKATFFSGSMSDLYNDRDSHHDFNASAVAGWHNDSKTLGFLIGLQSSNEHIRRDGVEALGTVSAGAANPSGAGVDPAAGPTSLNVTNPSALLPNAINAALFEQQRRRDGGNAVLEFKPNDNIHLEVNVLHVKLSDNNYNASDYVFPGWWRGGVVSSGNVENGIIDSGTIDENIGVMDLFYRKAVIKTSAYDEKLTFTQSDWSVSEQAGYTKATGGTQAQYYIEPLLSAPGAGVGTTSYSFSGAATHPGFTFAVPGVNSTAADWSVGGPWWNGNIAADPETDKEKYAQIDAAYAPHISFIKKFRVGARYTDHDTGQNWYNISLVTLPFHTLADFGPGITPDNYLNGIPGVTSDMKYHVTIDPGLLLKAVYAAPYQNPDGSASNLTMQQALEAGDGFQPAQSFSITEKTDAFYGQADFGYQQLSGNIGLRYVETDTTSRGYATSGSVITTLAQKKSYDNFLPSFNLAYNLSPDLVTRFAASETIARPNYADLSSSVTLYDSIRQGNGGNPNLDPYKSTNLDYTLEWYFQKNSVLAANFFYKDISNYILNSNGTEDYFNQNLGKVTPYTISRPENAGKAKSQGVSLFYQHTFASGFGISANYTYVDAHGHDGQDLPFASKNQVNVSPFYENGRFLIRLTYAWQSDYFTNVNRGDNVYTRGYTELDANAAYNITKNISLTLACTNLLDETYYVYTEVPAKMFQAEYRNGRRFQGGVHWTF